MSLPYDENYFARLKMGYIIIFNIMDVADGNTYLLHMLTVIIPIKNIMWFLCFS